MMFNVEWVPVTPNAMGIAGFWVVSCPKCEYAERATDVQVIAAMAKHIGAHPEDER